MVDIIVIAVLVLMIGGAGMYLYRAKKRGVKCVGCPNSKTCSGHCSGCSGSCNCQSSENKQ